MKHLKRCLALMVAAALALTLLAGCDTGGGKSSRLLLEVLMDQVENVSVATDPDFDRALKAAVQQGGGDPDKVLSALAGALGITAPLRFSVSGLGSGNAGQQGLDVMFLPGTNPDAAAGSASAVWLSILRGLEGNGGAYSARASLVEVNGGYILAIGVKVEQPGEAEDEPKPATLTGISVSGCKTDYFVGQSFDPTGMEITATYSNNTTKTITGITGTDKKGVSWTPDGALSTSDTSITISYGGKTTTVSVTVKEPTVDRIEVEPSSLTFEAGKFFTPSQITKVTASYTYGNDKEIAISECALTLTLPDNTTATVNTSYQFTKAGKYTLTVEYQGKTDTIEITVNPPTLTGIEITQKPKTEYNINETFDSTGMEVTAFYSDSNQTKVQNYTFTITDKDGTPINSPYTFTQAGGYTLTVTYEEKQASTTITVKDKGYIIEDGTYKVHNEDGLKAVASLVNGGETAINITLTKDISLTEKWTPILSYAGTFDGGGKTISGLTIDSDSMDYAGLFAFIESGGKVKNLTLKDVNITAGYHVGAIAGRNDGAIENCSVTGSVKGTADNSFVGGIAGWHYKGDITGCHSAATVKGVTYVGGIAGASNASITGCYSTGDVTATKDTRNDSFAGGVVGLNNEAVLTACYATGDVTGTGERVGGVVGDNINSIVRACYHANGTVYGSALVGGVVGWNSSLNSPITACYWGNDQSSGIGEDQSSAGQTTKVDGNVTWETAVDAMNTALQNAHTGWQYEFTGALPTLTKQ